jgi:molecular chaperone GrpE
MNSPEEMGNGPVVHDRRRIDPVTGQVREPDRAHGKHAASGPGGYGRNEGMRAQGSRHGRGAEPEGSAPAPGPDEHAGHTGPAGPAGPAGHTGQDRTADQAGNGAEAHTAPAGDTGMNEEMAKLREQLADRTADLQRIQAEYANYRKRVDRDRAAVREFALANVLTELLPALDAIGQARQHDELSGGFKSVAESLESAASKLGLVTYGESGEMFDPKIHEALAHSFSPDVTEVTCAEIFQPGYKVGDRILRPARVLVAEPATGPDGAAEPGADAGSPGQPGHREDN